MKKTNLWFTLIEVLLWILIFSIVVIWWFQVLSAVNIWKIKLLEKTNLSKDVIFFSEKFFDLIKKGWTIDYEEYFARRVIWTTTQSWHFSLPTWFWNYWGGWVLGSVNYWNWLYFCRSWNTTSMGTWGCYENASFKTQNVVWWYQRYWQYAFQFIDYNSNLNNDLWDENGDGNIIWDDDDENLWLWPIVFSWWTDVKEIYLISWDRKKRTFFRWNFKQDPDAPPSEICSGSTFWTGCIWTVEFLVLDGKDWWENHNSWATSTWSFDGKIDTWIINSDFSWWAEVIAWSNTWSYWQPLFPNNINIKNFEVYLYPNIQKDYAWKDTSSSTNINPYLRIKMTLVPSWKKRKAIVWDVPEFHINTTINLADYFSN